MTALICSGKVTYCLSVLFEYTNGWPMLCDWCKAFYAQVNSSTWLHLKCNPNTELFCCQNERVMVQPWTKYYKISTKKHLCFKDLSFSPLSTRLLQKTLLKLKCLIVWGVNVQYLAFVWLTQDFIGWLRHGSLFHSQIESYCAKKNFGCYWCYFYTLNLFSLFLPPFLRPHFVSTSLLVLFYNQSLFWL